MNDDCLSSGCDSSCFMNELSFTRDNDCMRLSSPNMPKRGSHDFFSDSSVQNKLF